MVLDQVDICSKGLDPYIIVFIWSKWHNRHFLGWKCYQIFFIYKNFTDFLKLSGPPFNCAEDIIAYYEIEDCGEIDELQVLFSEKENGVLPLQ